MARKLKYSYLMRHVFAEQVRGEAISEGFAEAALIRMRDAGYRVFALVLLGDYMPLFLRAATKLGMIGKGYT